MVITFSKHIIKYIFYLFILYVFIYNPAFESIGFGSIKFLYIIILIPFIFYKKKIKGFSSFFKSEFLFLVFLFLYALFKSFYGGERSFVNVHLSMIVELFFLPISIIILWQEHIKSNDFFKYLFITLVIAAFISTFLIFNPEINYNIRGLMSSFIEKDSLIFAFRGYGISDSLLFSYGIVQGIGLSVCFLCLKKNKIYILWIPFFLLSIMFNARIGFIPPLLIMIYLIIVKKDFSILFYSIILFFFFVVFGLSLLSESENSLNWVMEFFYEISDLIFGTHKAKYSTADTLSDMYIWPSDISSWLFGTGRDISEPLTTKRSDIGYFIQLNYGGLIYCILLYSYFFYTIKHALKSNSMENHFLLFLLIIMFVSNYKGPIFLSNSTIRLIIIICMYTIHKNYVINKFQV